MPCNIAGCSCATYVGGNVGASLSPLCLRNFFAAGCITIPLNPPENMKNSHDLVSSDDWCPFSSLVIGPEHQWHSQDDNLRREIQFLISKEFVASTFRFSLGQLVLRIYLIPYDLGGVQGRLRARKEDVLSSARRCMRNLLPRIVQDPQLWASGLTQNKDVPLLFGETADSRTLAEIYSNIVSPSPHPWPECPNLIPRLLDFNEELENLGMRSRLFKYQRRSVAAMIQQELDTRARKDPLYIELRGMNDERIYYQPSKMELLHSPPMTSPCQGGILCEELGTGKTVMVLALVLSTLHQLSSPEPSIIDNERPILTPIAFRHFPSSTFIAARSRKLRKKRAQFDNGNTVPSFVELLLHHSRLHPSPTQFERWESALEVNLLPKFKANVPFYYDYGGEVTDLERTKRSRANVAPKTVYLTTATLLFVPLSLVAQWSSEILKHVEVPLRVLIVQSGEDLPRPQVLATEYDIVIMSYERLSSEAAKGDASVLHTWDVCTCKEFSDIRVPNCTCPQPAVSPLLQVRWKRLVIDEGHISGTMDHTLSHFVRILSVERKWVVTGTPSKNLLGLNFGQHTVSGVEEGEESLSDSNGNSITVSEDESLPSNRVWTKHDVEDLRRLGVMLRNFVGVPLFKLNPRLFSSHVAEALIDKGGPRPGAVLMLSQIFQAYMIRHRIEQVEQDVILPPLSTSVVYMDLSWHSLRSYNLLQALLAINAVDSERRHQDYMFHPRNAKALAETVENMSQIMFWSANDELQNLEDLLKSPQQFFDRAKERNMSEGDQTLLTSAFDQLKEIAQDWVWRGINSHAEVAYSIYNIDDDIFRAWTRTLTPVNTTTGIERYMHVDRILKLREMVLRHPLAAKEQLVQWGLELSAQEEAYHKWLKEAKLDRKQFRGASESRFEESMNHVDSAKVKEVQKELRTAWDALDQTDRIESAEITAAVNAVTSGKTPTSLLQISILANTRIGPSGSTKLNFILQEIQEYSAEEKFLIFSASPLTLAHVAEGLELLQIKYLNFNTRVSPRIREQFVMTFETSSTYRVFLMDLKYGARGLNLISASRIIFCEPVWHADVESQAIKRAHRIGQTRPITVKTLAIRGTAEEFMSIRRQALKGIREKLPSMTNEVGMRDFIANPKFITLQQSLAAPLNIRLLPLPETPEGLNHDLGQNNAHAVDPGADAPPLKKRRIVAFAE